MRVLCCGGAAMEGSKETKQERGLWRMIRSFVANIFNDNKGHTPELFVHRVWQW